MTNPIELLRAVEHVAETKQAYEEALQGVRAFFPTATVPEILQLTERLAPDTVQTKPRRPTSPKKKAASKKRAKAAPKKARSKMSTAGQKRALEGNREVRQGARPALRKAMIKVMGSKTMTIPQIAEALAERGWSPNSKRPHGCISVMLQKQDFERVEHGRHRVVKGSKAKPNKVKKAASSKPNDRPTMDQVRQYIRRRKQFVLKDLQKRFGVTQPVAAGLISRLIAMKVVTRVADKPATWSPVT